MLYHLLDSAAVAELLWQKGLTPGARRQFGDWLDLPAEDCGRLLAFWTSLHDLGKATPSFQAKHVPSKEQLMAMGFDFPFLAPAGIRHHSLLSQWILSDFGEILDIQPLRLFNLLRYAIGGHHGTFHIQEDLQQDLAREKNLGGQRWSAARMELVRVLKTLLMPPRLMPLNLDQTEQNAFFNLLTGFFVSADWLASQDDLFEYHPAPLPPTDYLQISRQRADLALTRTGWNGWQPDGETPTFQELFSFEPHPLQDIVLQQAQGLADPFMLIIEAPTGCGKTEIALSIADLAIRRSGLRGWYIAMPTQATSNQMFGRACAFLTRCYPRQKKINVQLAHGNALLNEEFQQIRLAFVEDPEGAGEGTVSAMEWFLPRKRTLLAPFGVGTVDQAFMSVLRTRHAFLRLFGLHRKVIIFDEVHAYDTYMQRIFTRLLAWLRAVGSSVILLSATLPDQTRRELLNAFQPEIEIDTITAAYPRLSINSGNRVNTVSLGAYPDRTVQLTRVAYQSSAWMESLRGALSEGGCAAIICNTVDRAQQVFREVQAAGLVEPGQLHLLHARMPFCWRQEKEKAILGQFGKRDDPESERMRRGIVVATQIIEQSLDLDFDFMISDLAPIDLLIQRLGRLHRHSDQPYAPLRPSRLSQPTCWVCQPEAPDAASLPMFGTDAYVYEPAILQRTFFVLQTLEELRLPSMSDELINQVYSENPLPTCSAAQNELLQQAVRSMNQKHDYEVGQAENRLMGDVDVDNSAAAKVVYLKEDSQIVGKETQALTRSNVLPSVTLVCLTRQNGNTFLLDRQFPLNLDAHPNLEARNHALMSLVSVTKSRVVEYFNGLPRHAAWKTVPALRYAQPIVFEEGKYVLPDGTELSLDHDLGLLVTTEKNDHHKPSI